MQALVVTHDTHKQEKAIRELLTPVGQAFGIDIVIRGFVKAVGYHVGLVLVVRKHIAGRKVIGGGGDNPVNGAEEPVHQRAIELQKHFLSDNVGVITQYAGLAVCCVEMQQIHQWPGEVVVDDIMLPCQFPEPFEYLTGQPGGCEVDVLPGLVHLMAAHLQRSICRGWTERQHAVFHPQGLTGLAQLKDGLLNTTRGFRHVGLEQMQHAHHEYLAALYVSVVIRAQRSQLNWRDRSSPPWRNLSCSSLSSIRRSIWVR